MEPDDCWDASVAPNTLRHPQHHDHDSDQEEQDDDDDTPVRPFHSFDENERPSNYGHATHLLRRPTAVGRVASDSSGAVLKKNEDVGFHQFQETRHRSPIASHRTSSNQNGNARNRSQQQQQQKHHKKGTTRGGQKHQQFGMLIRLFVGIGGVGYLLLMVLLLSQETPIPPYPIARPSHSQRVSREYADKKRTEVKRNAEIDAAERAALRRQQTRPPAQSPAVVAKATKRYEFLLADDVRRRNSDAPRTRNDDSPARIKDLCGTHARNASVAHPNSFLAGDALNNKARVMITGVLNPVGFRLALALAERCGVEVITGIDPMYPNTLQNRLNLLERMQILATSIPKMIQPIVQPLLGLNPRLNKKRSGKQPMMLASTGELNLQNFHPTHIVHLASFTPDEYHDTTAAREGRINVNSPYISNNQTPPFYQIRSSMASMEHVLASIASEDKTSSRPHFVYASSMGVVRDSSSSSIVHDELHSRVKLVDEILADAYHTMRGVESVGLRFPRSVYGPWGRPGTPEYDLAEAAVQHWNSQSVNDAEMIESAGIAKIAQDDRDFVYVDDMVDAIIAAMQYRPDNSSPSLFNVGSESVASLSTAAQIVDSLKSADGKSVADSVALTKTMDSSPVFQATRDYLKWSPTTPLTEGMTTMLAWHLDKAVPFGPPTTKKALADSTMLPPSETGDAFRTRNNAPTCATDDALCHSGVLVLPCVSECASKSNCAPSVFDPIAKLIRDVTEGCDVILYTNSLGKDVEDLGLESEYMEDGKRIVCNFAFIPQESKLVKSVVKKVPDSQLEKFGIPLNKRAKDWKEKKLDGLNGRLLYKGWILLWLKDATTPLSTADEFLLKLSPGKLFSSSVKQAVYVAENFPVTPNIQDVLFLADETRRSARKQKSVYRNEEDGKKHKYVLEAEPERRAVMLAAPLRRMVTKGEYETKERVTVMDASKYMTFEVGGDPMEHETPSVRKQREFYERVPSFINRVDLKSPFEPFYRYGLSHWIRTRWIVHDLKVEEGRQLRCEWYQEHVRWGNDIDQFSFAYVMERRELRRRMANREPDDRTKTEERPELKELTDAHEWYALTPQKEADKSVASAEGAKGSPTLYMRIMSERFMLVARKLWAEKYRRKKKHR